MKRHLNTCIHVPHADRYLQLCDRFSPVMRHFFVENFPSPLEWFAKRMQYTRSVAVSSMVGHVVGLGDRHINNILIDKCVV